MAAQGACITAPKHADVIYFGGTIITMDDDRPEVEAVAVADGRIIATGQKEYVMRTKEDDTVLVDLEGRTLMPSFIDSPRSLHECAPRSSSGPTSPVCRWDR